MLKKILYVDLSVTNNMVNMLQESLYNSMEITVKSINTCTIYH